MQKLPGAPRRLLKNAFCQDLISQSELEQVDEAQNEGGWLRSEAVVLEAGNMDAVLLHMS